MKDSNLVVVETIPEYLRANHTAAGNSGVWPHNGAERVVMDRADAEELVEHDPEWSEILESEDPADYTDDGQAQETATLEEQWWAWHDADYSRWDYETVQEAEAVCAAWVRGESDVGPERDCGDDDDDEQKTMMKTYRACYWISSNCQADVLLTCEDQSHMTDDELLKIALRNAGEVGLDLSTGSLVIGEWTEQ